MSGRYFCQHHDEWHETHSDYGLHACGCDGTRHDACERRLAPAGTPRPERWPVFLTWRTAV